MDYNDLLEKACAKIETKAERRKREEAEARRKRLQEQKDELVRFFGLPGGRLPECKTKLVSQRKASNGSIVNRFTGIIAFKKLTLAAHSATSCERKYGIQGSALYAINIANMYKPEESTLISWSTDKDMLSGIVCVSFTYEVKET